eukprot:scaffold270058_cov31-Prasinocladus_malaysianus.AAC.2
MPGGRSHGLLLPQFDPSARAGPHGILIGSAGVGADVGRLPTLGPHTIGAFQELMAVQLLSCKATLS